jgi:hypothetical protein
MAFWPRVSYVIYTPNYEPGVGEVWEHQTISRAKRKARSYGMGATIVRWRDGYGAEGTDLELIWDGKRFKKHKLILPSSENA